MNKRLLPLPLAVVVTLCSLGALSSCSGGDGGPGGPSPTPDAGPTGEDGGEDGGDDGPSEGPAPDTADLGGLDLVLVADPGRFDLAWSEAQPAGAVTQWWVGLVRADGRTREVARLPASVRTLTVAAAGVGESRTYYVVGLGADGGVALGQPGAGGAPDAGGGCQGPLDCNADRVCHFGACQAQSCASGGQSTCPTGYFCQAQLCTRFFGSDAGVDGGPALEVDLVPRELRSEARTAAAGAAGFSPEAVVSPYRAASAAMVAFDAARQFLAVEQGGQLFGFFTDDRGESFQRSTLDTLGSRVQLSYSPESGVLFACYNVGTGVRLRASDDWGRTWPRERAGAVDYPPDGGAVPRVQDCDLAAWTAGQALMVTHEGAELVVRTVGPELTLGAPVRAFLGDAPSAPPDGGVGPVYNPRRPVIATLPSEGVVHVAFVGDRTVYSGGVPQGSDAEIYAVRKDSGAGRYGPVVRINRTALPSGDPQVQDDVALVVDPKSQNALAAFTSRVEDPTRTHDVVILSLYSAAVKQWATSTDLSVTVKSQSGGEFLLFPGRPANELWDHFSPQLAVTPEGRVQLSFVAGRYAQGGQPPQYGLWTVPFDFEQLSPVSNAKAWFVPPATKASTTFRAVFETRSPLLPLSSPYGFAVDGALSTYGVFLEATGNDGDVPGRPVFVHRP